MKEALTFSLAPHLMWAFWAVIQANASEIEFGYMEFGVGRLIEYFRMKKLVFGL